MILRSQTFVWDLLKGIKKMNIKTILFDLDGTLLPMDQDIFIKGYLGGLAKKLAPYGYNLEIFPKAMWAGTARSALEKATDSPKSNTYLMFSKAANPRDTKTAYTIPSNM